MGRNLEWMLTSGIESFWSSPTSTLLITAMLKDNIPTNTATYGGEQSNARWFVVMQEGEGLNAEGLERKSYSQ